MTSKKRDFYGKEVADAIQKACEALQVPQEQLDIEVIETGSTGIFGLIRKKAQIRVSIKREEQARKARKEEVKPADTKKAASPSAQEEAGEKTGVQEKSQALPKEGGSAPSTVVPDAEESADKAETVEEIEDAGSADEIDDVDETEDVEEIAASDADGDEEEDEDDENGNENGESDEDLPEDVPVLIREELGTLLRLMGYPSPVEVSAKGTSVLCHVGEEHEEILTGQDGKTLDSIQYLLRKIVARKVPNRLRLTVDVGNYREKRLAELKNRALELAEKVKADGKTQVIPALSPSERRVIHMSLQDDKEIRSRSVGDGLFKKILIYKPGKGGKGGGRKRPGPRGRRGQTNRKKSE